MSLRGKIANKYLLRKKRQLLERHIGRTFDPLVLRKWANMVTAKFKPPVKVRFEPITINEQYAEWVIPPKMISNQVLLYVHGGGYVGGSAKTYRGLTGKLAEATHLKTLAVDYGLAPENPYPDGVNDVVAAFKWLMKLGYSPKEIVIAGDSAGGGLALSSTLSIRDQLKKQPAGLILLSPWTDLAASNPSFKENENKDPVLSGIHMPAVGKLYAGSHSTKDPGVSPFYADPKGLCPILVHVGTEEVLLDDSVLLAQRYQAAGADIQLKVWKDCMHVFHISWKFLPEGRKAIKEIVQFIKGLPQR